MGWEDRPATPRRIVIRKKRVLVLSPLWITTAPVGGGGGPVVVYVNVEQNKQSLLFQQGF